MEASRVDGSRAQTYRVPPDPDYLRRYSDIEGPVSIGLGAGIGILGGIGSLVGLPNRLKVPGAAVAALAGVGMICWGFFVTKHKNDVNPWPSPEAPPLPLQSEVPTLPHPEFTDGSRTTDRTGERLGRVTIGDDDGIQHALKLGNQVMHFAGYDSIAGAIRGLPVPDVVSHPPTAILKEGNRYVAYELTGVLRLSYSTDSTKFDVDTQDLAAMMIGDTVWTRAGDGTGWNVDGALSKVANERPSWDAPKPRVDGPFAIVSSDGTESGGKVYGGYEHPFGTMANPTNIYGPENMYHNYSLAGAIYAADHIQGDQLVFQDGEGYRVASPQYYRHYLDGDELVLGGSRFDPYVKNWSGKAGLAGIRTTAASDQVAAAEMNGEWYVPVEGWWVRAGTSGS